MYSISIFWSGLVIYLANQKNKCHFVVCVVVTPNLSVSALSRLQERQKSSDKSYPCSFRLSSEGLPLLLPYIKRQILYAPLADFQLLLKHRTVKFVDLVDASFSEKASSLMPGCCVLCLNEGKPIIYLGFYIFLTCSAMHHMILSNRRYQVMKLEVTTSW